MFINRKRPSDSLPCRSIFGYVAFQCKLDGHSGRHFLFGHARACFDFFLRWPMERLAAMPMCKLNKIIFISPSRCRQTNLCFQAFGAQPTASVRVWSRFRCVENKPQELEVRSLNQKLTMSLRSNDQE